ncbi:hypothetical protein GCM10020369_84290 [Cryptosporangium minutisporangium]|uniref:Uncharacterized protein n=1 Tax=Cryptosporangium minutisporangium TaxID=113569 RepID=A0ABP6TCZ8_9ACTN
MYYASPWHYSKWTNVTDRDSYRRVISNVLTFPTGFVVQEIHHRIRARSLIYRRCIAVGWTGPNGQGGYPITRTQEYITFRVEYQVKVKYNVLWGYRQYWRTSNWYYHRPSSSISSPRYITRPEVWRGV